MIPSNKSEYFDVVIIGCGPAGTTLGAQLAQGGLSVLMLERHTFPRYHIGESLTGSVGDYIRSIGLEDAVNEMNFPRKSGINFIGPTGKPEIFIPVESPTWQVRRSEFDKLLLDYAISKGATHRYGSVKKIFRDGHKVIGVGYRPVGSNTDLLDQVRCKFIADASGHGTVLSKHRIAGRRRVDTLWQQLAVFTQFKGALRDSGEIGNNSIVYYSAPNHWAWFTPISPEVTSVGIVVPTVTVRNYGQTSEDFLHWGLENINPDLARRVQQGEMVEPIRVVNNYSYRIEPFIGDGWLCLGDACRFLDPVLPFGISNGIEQAKGAAKAILNGFQNNDLTINALKEYEEFSQRGYHIASNLVRYFWHFLTIFSRQARGTLRKDITQLLDGHLFTAQELTVLAAMDKTLESLAPHIPEGPAREIAVRIKHAYTQGLDAAYITNKDNGVQLSLVASNDAPDFHAAMSDFIETLHADFPQANLTITRYLPGDPLPGFEEAQEILNIKKESTAPAV